MDPTANIRRQRELIERLTALQDGANGYEGEIADRAFELAEHVTALDEWRQRGGFDPYRKQLPDREDLTAERPDIWHDEEGVWVEAGAGPLGPFKSEGEAERAYTTAMVGEVSRALAERTDDESAQGWAADLNQALTALRAEPPANHTFTVTVGDCTNDQAHKVMTERLGHDEDYGFDYSVDWTEKSDDTPGGTTT